MTIESVNPGLERGPALFTRASGVCVCGCEGVSHSVVSNSL